MRTRVFSQEEGPHKCKIESSVLAQLWTLVIPVKYDNNELSIQHYNEQSPQFIFKFEMKIYIIKLLLFISTHIYMLRQLSI